MTLKFGYRELNGAVDYMAKKESTLHLDEEFSVDHLDNFFADIIDKDLRTYFTRCTSKPCTDCIILK